MGHIALSLHLQLNDSVNFFKEVLKWEEEQTAGPFLSIYILVLNFTLLIFVKAFSQISSPAKVSTNKVVKINEIFHRLLVYSPIY